MGNIVFSCIGHNFHLITGPLLIKPKRKKDVLSENADNEDIHQDDIEDLYEDCFDDLYVDHQIIIYIREIVEEIRKLSSFIKKFIKNYRDHTKTSTKYEQQSTPCEK